jgi:hypothetical protein
MTTVFTLNLCMTGYEWPLRMTGYGGPTGNTAEKRLRMRQPYL